MRITQSEIRSIYLYKGKENLPKTEELDAHLISNFSGLVSRFESLDSAKKYPIKTRTMRNIQETFKNRFSHSYLVDILFFS